MQHRPTNHYATLGLHAKCTPGQIRDAYRILAKKFHPDVNPGSIAAVRKTQELNEAYAVLGDPVRRRAYDDALGTEEKPKGSARSAGAQKNVSQDVALRIEEFFRGSMLEVRVNDPGNPEGPETYALEVPSGTAPGARFRIRREGFFSGGIIAVRVVVRPDFRFKVRGSDLRCDLRINAKRAAQGGTESVRGALGEFLRVPIPANVARGEVIRVSGEGLPKARGGRGDLLVRVIYTPEVRITRIPR